MVRHIKGIRKNKISFVLTLFVVCILAIAYFFSENHTNFNTNTTKDLTDGNTMLVEFMDVGQGDSTLIILPDGKHILVDAANPNDGKEIAEHLSDKGITKIDYLIATHPHADHIGGMAYIIENFEIGQIFAPKVATADVPTSKTYENFLKSVKNKGLKITAVKGGNILFKGDNYKAECFAPNADEYDGLNNYSVVFKLTYGIDTFLFMGDAETTVEKEIMNMGYNLKADVLKIGHHGSSSSSNEEFLSAVSPTYAVISCGKSNSYGHPHEETISALNNLKGLKTYYRTDKDLTVTAASYGNGKIEFVLDGSSVVED